MCIPNSLVQTSKIENSETLAVEKAFRIWKVRTLPASKSGARSGRRWAQRLLAESAAIFAILPPAGALPRTPGTAGRSAPPSGSDCRHLTVTVPEMQHVQVSQLLVTPFRNRSKIPESRSTTRSTELGTRRGASGQSSPRVAVRSFSTGCRAGCSAELVAIVQLSGTIRTRVLHESSRFTVRYV